MKRSALTYCILSLFAILGFSACDVHEFPDMPERRPYELVLDFTNAIDMGFYQTIDYSRASTEASPSGTKTQTEITYDIRYTVKRLPHRRQRWQPTIGHHRRGLQQRP